MTTLDDTIRGCLNRIARCQIGVVGILADYLDEIGHAKRGQVRRLWDWYIGRERFWQSRDYKDTARRCLTSWENICYDRRHVRDRIAKLFGKRWKRKPVLAFK